MKSMKWLTVAALLAGLAVGTAQANPSFSLGAGVSYWQLLDKDVRHELDADGMWGASIYPRLWFTEYVGMEVRASGYAYQDDTSYRDSETGEKVDVDMTLTCGSLELGLLLKLPVADTPLSVYGGAGGGYYYFDVDFDVDYHRHRHSWHHDKSYSYKLDDVFGWWGMAGVKLNLTDHFALFGEGRYVGVKPESDGEKYDFSSVQYVAGLTYDF